MWFVRSHEVRAAVLRAPLGIAFGLSAAIVGVAA